MTRDMTPQALACRADEVRLEDTVNCYLGGEDEREVTAYYTYEECELDGPTPDHFTVRGLSRNLIGVVLQGAFREDVLTREQARDMFGDKVVAAWEGEAWDWEDGE